MLQDEAGISLNAVDSVERIRTEIINGHWDRVLARLPKLRLQSALLRDLFEHIVLELLEMNEEDAAEAILRETPVMEQLKVRFNIHYR